MDLAFVGLLGATHATQAVEERYVLYNPCMEHGAGVYDLALMLDPNPKTRITTRQLIGMTNAQDLYF